MYSNRVFSKNLKLQMLKQVLITATSRKIAKVTSLNVIRA